MTLRIYIPLRFLLPLLFYYSASAQTCDTVSFQNIYWFKGSPYSPIAKMVPDANGNFFIGSNTIHNDNINSPSNFDALITKTNARGTPLWAKEYGSPKTDQLYDMTLTKDGGIVFVGLSKEYSVGEGWIYKIDAKGKQLWSFGIGRSASNLTKVISLNDGSVAIVGNIIVDYKEDDLGNILEGERVHGLALVIDANGKLKWFKEFYTEHEWDHLYSVMQLKDGSLLLLGNTASGAHAKDGQGTIFKLNSDNGDIIWQKKIKTFPSSFKELASTNIRLYGNKNILQIDKDGNLLWAKNMDFDVDLRNVFPVAKTYINEDEEFFLGQMPFGNGIKPYFFCIKDFTAVSSAYSYQNINKIGAFAHLEPILFNGQFLIYGALSTKKFSTSSTSNEYQGYAIETDSKGYTPCAKPEPLNVTFTPIDTLSTSDVFIAPHDILYISPIYEISIHDLSPNITRDCYKTECCLDTIINMETEICKGAKYTLPNGNTVDSPGIYTSYFKTLKGCDSIINVSVSVKDPLKVSLGNDTCFAKSNTIIYSFSYPKNEVQYLWQDGTSDSFKIAKTAGLYWVKIMDKCTSASDSVKILKDCTLPIYIPNSFTPNYDGVNDIFKVGNMSGQQLVSFTVYNRFGKKVYSTSNAAKGWDGTIEHIIQPTGAYVYLIKYIDIKGSIQIAKGSVMLLR